MKVLVTDPIADAGLDVLREAGHEVRTAYDVETGVGDGIGDENLHTETVRVRRNNPCFTASRAP